MAKKKRPTRAPFVLPPELIPDFDQWGTPEEEEKSKRLNEWLRATDNMGRYHFEWVPAYLAERRKLAGLPPRVPPRRKGPLPDRVRRLLASLEADIADGGPPDEAA